MRICIYTETALPRIGGQQLVVDALARQYAAMGHSPTVLTQRPRRPLVADDASLPYPVVRHRRFVSTWHFVPWYRRYLIALHARERFDVIHCHSVYPTGSVATDARTRAALGDVPVVITSHGADVWESDQRTRRAVVLSRYEEAVRRADALVSIGRFTTEGFLRLDPSAGERIVSIPNGVDLAGAGAPAPGRPAGAPAGMREGAYVLFIGRLARRKGVDLLLRALPDVPRLNRGGPDVLLAGEGEEMEALRRLVTEVGVADRVRFLGRTTGAAKDYYLRNARVVAIPSREWEAFPLVVLEAYAAARPVVATDIPGLADLVEPGETGQLAAPESPAALAAALAAVCGDPAAADRMGAVARGRAEEYSWPVIAGQYLSLFESLARKVPQGRTIS